MVSEKLRDDPQSIRHAPSRARPRSGRRRRSRRRGCAGPGLTCLPRHQSEGPRPSPQAQVPDPADHRPSPACRPRRTPHRMASHIDRVSTSKHSERKNRDSTCFQRSYPHALLHNVLERTVFGRRSSRTRLLHVPLSLADLLLLLARPESGVVAAHTERRRKLALTLFGYQWSEESTSDLILSRNVANRIALHGERG